MVPPEEREWTVLLKAALEGGPVAPDHPTDKLIREMLGEFKTFKESWNEDKLRSVIREEQADICEKRSKQLKEELKDSIEAGISIDRIAEKAANSRSVQLAKWALGAMIGMITMWLTYTWNLAENADRKLVTLEQVPKELDEVRMNIRSQSGKLDQILARIHQKPQVP